MRTIDRTLIENLVSNFSHGAGDDFDPALEKGCQRESWSTLGFGWIYHAISAQYDSASILVIGSGRGFSAACFALASQPCNPSRVVLVDPGYGSWEVGGGDHDSAAAFWKSPAQAKAHFEEHLGLTNISLVKTTAQKAISDFQQANRHFDVIFIDANHSYAHALADLMGAVPLLTDQGIMLAHDAHCPHWPGVALAVEHLLLRHPEIHGITLPHYPGLALLQRQAPLISIRNATLAENERVNRWRKAKGVTERPLPDGSDPNPGQDTKDSRCGLFIVLLQGEPIAGFGIQHRTFSTDGPDDFTPDGGTALVAGFLCYGAVVREGFQGRGVWRSVIFELLRRLGDAGFYVITNHALKNRAATYQVERVGQTPHHTAYRIRPCEESLLNQRTRGYQQRNYESELRTAIDMVNRLDEDNRRQHAAIEAQRGALDTAQQELKLVTESLTWRSTAFLRKLFDCLRT